MVLYNGDRKWTAPTDFSKLILLPHPGMFPYVPRLMYHLVSVNTLDPKKLEELKDAVSTLFIVEQSDESNISEKLDRIASGILDILDPDLRKEIYRFIMGILNRREIEEKELESISEIEVRSMLRTTVDRMWKKAEEKGKQEGKQEGIWEGIKEGERKGKTEVVHNMLNEGVELEFIAKMTNLTLEEVKKLAKD